jgi:hypothetical protein
MTKRRPRVGFEFPRELLLVEVARRCRACGETARLGLTKAEARAYQGFECEHCEEWNDDGLSEPDIPDWWEELRVTGLDAPPPAPRAESAGGGEAEVVGRLSDEWRRAARAAAPADGTEDDGTDGEGF